MNIKKSKCRECGELYIIETDSDRTCRADRKRVYPANGAVFIMRKLTAIILIVVGFPIVAVGFIVWLVKCFFSSGMDYASDFFEWLFQ